MQTSYSFCTCTDKQCPNHPTNHQKGCTPCILKNLTLREIPSCFFHILETEHLIEGYSFSDFAELVLEKQQEERQ